MRAQFFRLMTLLLALLAMPAFAQGTTHIVPRLLAESAAPRAGSTVTLAVAMTPQKGWHGYWRNPGDAGVETLTTWTLPPGVRAGRLAYPVPQTLLVNGIMNYVYEGPYALTVPLAIPRGLATGTRLPVRVKLDWLECTETMCVPATATLATALTVGDGAIRPEVRAQFDRFRAAFPRPLGGTARFTMTGGRFRLGVPLPATLPVRAAYFFPLTEGAVDYSAPQRASRSGDTLVIETKAATGKPSEVEGVLKLGPNDGLVVRAVPGSVPAGGAVLGAAEEGAPGGGGLILAAIGGAFLGGILLNVMPCVFPILSLKALSLAKAGGGSERAARIDASAYAGGVVLVCLALGGGLLLLRAGGSEAGWAFQLQDSRVILVLLLLTGAIAFNLAGLFELPMLTGGGSLAGRGGAAGSFWTGALAAFVATPCTGPFMAGALGVALILPTWAALGVFAGLGLGIAFPFLLIGFVPAIRRRLPKPGAWMATMRHILAVPMFATALGLAWVLGRQAGADALVAGLAALLLLGLGLWWVGLRQSGGRTRAWLPAAPLLACALVPLALAPAAAPAVQTAEALPLGAEPFSEARLAALTQAGTPTFVYFTADWCLSCKVNEKAVLERQEVADAFAAKKVHVLVGDWTRGDTAIGRFLAAKGRSGVPLYLYYPPNGTLQELPQLLTIGMLTGLAA